MSELCLMQVHAHPDDEASKGSGVAARSADEGVRTVLVTCTGGEAGDILNPAVDTPEVRADLAAVRIRELEESVRVLKYSQLYLLGYRDSGMPDTEENKHPDAFTNADFDDAVGKLVEIVRRERPQVICTYGDDHSGYPHPDHIRTHEISVAAFSAAGDASRFPDAGPPFEPSKLYYMGWTVRRIRTLHETLLRLGKESPWAERIDQFGDDESDRRFSTRIDVAKWIPQRSASLLAHRTQVAPDSFWFAVPDELLIETWPHEEYILASTRVEVERDDRGFETDLFSGLR